MRLFTVCTDLDLLSAQSGHTTKFITLGYCYFVQTSKQDRISRCLCTHTHTYMYIHTHTCNVHTHTHTHTHTHAHTHTHTHTHTHQLNVGEEEAGIGNICQYHLRFPVMHLLQMLRVQEAHHYMHVLPITPGIYRTYPLVYTWHVTCCSVN